MIRSAISACILCGLLATACGSEDPTAPEPPDNTARDTVRIPLTDLGTGTYKGFEGGLYPNGSNTMPVTHAQRGVLASKSIQPLDALGRPSADGKYVLISIGMSNVSQEWCAQAGNSCNAWTFSGKAAVDPAVNHTTLVILNGAAGGQTADLWDAPDETNYERVRTQVLAPAGLTEAQVQVVWLGAVRRQPTVALPDANADAYILLGWLGNVARALKIRYPNLRQVFVSSRTYAGFATTTLNPEPYAYETGFAFKWLVEGQIKQVDSGVIDPRAGDVGPARTAWMAWGPYFWARDAAHPRSDGLFWVPADFEPDGTHESMLGEEKAGQMLLQFFTNSPHTSCWFLAGRTC